MGSKRRRMGLFLAAAVLLASTGCGVGGSGAGSAQEAGQAEASGTEESTAQSSQEPAAQKRTLKYVYWGSAVEGDIVKGICEEYQRQNPDVTIDAVHVPDSYEEKLTTMIAANQEPDLAYINEGMAYELAEGGKLFNCFEMLDRDPDFDLDDYVPGVWFEWEPGKALGRRIGIAAAALYYNVDAVNDAGLDPFPTDPAQALDWDEFVRRLKLLTIDGNGNNADSPDFDPENIDQYGLSLQVGSDAWVMMTLLNTSGIGWCDDEGTEFALASPEGAEYVQKIADLFNVHHVAPNPVQSKTLPGAEISLTSRKVAVSITGNWVCADFAAAGANFDIGVVPSFGDYHGSLFCSPTVIFNSTEDIDLTWDFYKFVANPEYCLDFYSSGISIPVMKDWLVDEDKLARWTNNPEHPAGYQQGMLQPLLDGGIPMPSDTVKGFDKQWNLVQAALDPVWLGQQTAEEALLGIKDQVEAEMSGKYTWTN